MPILMRFPSENAGQKIIVKNSADMVSRNHELAFTIGAR
jgi:hypothetical protein